MSVWEMVIEIHSGEKQEKVISFLNEFGDNCGQAKHYQN